MDIGYSLFNTKHDLFIAGAVLFSIMCHLPQERSEKLEIQTAS